ncbi:MAG: hypothetical protein L3J07_03210 [Candidatus Magasanikbacteria bacterium]|nr:hypothetical protein [Candidatus Magasanikbacteria bacterium]
MFETIQFCFVLFIILWLVVLPIKYYEYSKEKKRLAKVFYDEYFRDENWFAEKRIEIKNISVSENFSEDEILILNNLKDNAKFWLELRKRR